MRVSISSRRSGRSTRFLSYLLRMVVHIKHVSTTAHEALVDTAHDTKEREDLVHKWNSRIGAVDELKKHQQFLSDAFLVCHVENYLNYLSSLLKKLFLTRPETLRSAEKLDLETVLRHDSIEDLVVTIAERKVDAMSYASFSDLAEYFNEKFHIELVPVASLPQIVGAIETRNPSVHNRCLINQRYSSRTGQWADRTGKLRDLEIDRVAEMVKTTATSVLSVDKVARQRLKVAGHRLPKD